MSDRLRETARKIEAMVMSRFREVLADTSHADKYGIGAITREVDITTGQTEDWSVAVLRAVAEKTVPPGWEWEVLSPVASSPIIFIGEYRG
jgi:hypothetical protein